MRRVEIAGMALGAALVVAGVAVVYWPGALVVAGALLLVACTDRSRGSA